MRKWRVLDYGDLCADKAKLVEFRCMNCQRDSLLPVTGLPIAQVESGIVFDSGSHAMPRKTECPHCRHRFEKEAA